MCTDGCVSLKDPGIGTWGFRAVEDLCGKIPALSLSTLLAAEGIAHVDLLKLDIEGAEKEVFAGKTEWLAKTDFVMIELHERYKPGCEETVRAAMHTFQSWTSGELTCFQRI